MPQQLPGHRILSVIGQQGTGKTTIGKALAEKLGAQHIEASEVVRNLCGPLPRSEMHTTNARTALDPDWLGREVLNKMDKAWKRTIISGIREKEVHNFLNTTKAQLVVVALWAPEQERFLRVKRSKGVQTYEEFKEHEERELSIGLKFLLEEDHPMFITSSHIVPVDVVHLIHDQLSRGWKVTRSHKT